MTNYKEYFLNDTIHYLRLITLNLYLINNNLDYVKANKLFKDLSFNGVELIENHFLKKNIVKPFNKHNYNEYLLLIKKQLKKISQRFIDKQLLIQSSGVVLDKVLLKLDKHSKDILENNQIEKIVFLANICFSLKQQQNKHLSYEEFYFYNQKIEEFLKLPNDEFCGKNSALDLDSSFDFQAIKNKSEKLQDLVIDRSLKMNFDLTLKPTAKSK